MFGVSNSEIKEPQTRKMSDKVDLDHGKGVAAIV